MTEEQKNLLKEKLKLFFDNKLETLTNKFESDINLIETFKLNTYDNIIIPYREMNALIEDKKDKEKEVIKEKEKEKEKKKEEKKKEEKKVEDKKDLKTSINTTKTTRNENLNLTKTPMKSNRKKELDFKGKTEVLPKKSRVFSGKSSHKPELNTTFQKENYRKKNTAALTETNKTITERVRSSKTPFDKKQKEKEEKKENKPKKMKGISASAYKPSATKRFTAQKKPAEKNDKKKKEIKKDIKKVNIKNKDKKEKEEKKENKIILNYKGINPIPEDLKNKNTLYNIYLMLKGNYLSNKENCKLILAHPSLYKSFGNDIKFLLNDKKKELQSKITELESFLKKYDDLPNIVKSKFQPSKSALKSLMFVTKEEIENLIKKGNVSKEFADIFKIILYILDIKYDENLEGEELLQFFISEILVKDNKKNLMVVISEFFSKNEDLNLTREKIEKVENIIKTDDMTLSIPEMAKKNRLISYCTFLIKEFHEFITKKTSDGIPHYELKAKDKNLKEYKYKLATIENNGIPPKIEEVKKEENKEEKKVENEGDHVQKIENDDKKEEENNNEKKEDTQEIKNKEVEETKAENIQDNPQVEVQKVEEQNVKSENNEQN